MLLAPSLLSPEPSCANPLFQLAQSVWRPFASDEGRFSVLMPGTPALTRRTQNIVGTTTIDLRTFSVSRRQETIVYAVSYADYPTSLIQQANLNQPGNLNTFFTLVRDELVRSLKGRLIGDRGVSVNGVVGREFRIIRPGGRLLITRFFLVNQRAYELDVDVAQARERYLTGSIEGFMNSFRIQTVAASLPDTGERFELEPTYTRYMQAGYAAVNSRDYVAALSHFRNALSQRPSDPYASQAIRNVESYLQRRTPPASPSP